MEASAERKLLPIAVFFKIKKRLYHPRENLARSVRKGHSNSSSANTPLSNMINVQKDSLSNTMNLNHGRVKYSSIISPSLFKPKQSFIFPGKMMQMLISQEVSNPNQVISSVNLVRKCRTPSGIQQKSSIFCHSVRNSTTPSTATGQMPLSFRNAKLLIL